MPLDEKLFHPSLLTDPVVFDAAINSVSRHLDNATIQLTLETLLHRPGLAELIWSSADAETSERLTQWVLDNFPKRPDRFFGSTWQRLLAQLSNSLLSHNNPINTPEDLSKLHRDLLSILPAVQVLSTCRINDSLPTSSLEIFQKLQLPVPTTSPEIRKIGSELLSRLKRILRTYLDIIRRPELASVFRRLFFHSGTISHPSELSYSAYNSDTNASSLYFDVASGFGDWRILVSSRAQKHLRQARQKDGKIFMVIVKKIRDLSKGYFSPDNQKCLTPIESGIPVYEAKMTRDLRLVYHVHCVADSENIGEQQVLRLFGIFTHNDLDSRRHFWVNVSKQLSKYGTIYRSRCTFRNKEYKKGNHTFIPPATFPPESDEESPIDLPLTNAPDSHLDELHSLLILEKYVNLSKTLLYAMWVDLNVSHVFEVAPKEREIIEHKSSCYVIGRSGTGKTTTMLFKMLSIEWSSRQMVLEGSPHRKPRQIFVTQSRKLADKVEGYFGNHLRSLEAATLSPSELKEFAAREKSKVENEGGEQDEGPLGPHADDREDWRNNLPSKYSSLRDEHFPLFITYDRLCSLLEADLFEEKNALPKSSTIIDFYGIFLKKYWSHFPENLTKGLDPALVFSEFMGVIKGSEETLDLPEGFLHRQEYLERSGSLYGDRSDQIYDMFDIYRRRKRNEGDRDPPDRTQAILKALRQQIPGTTEIDYLYVDEVQDNLLIDTLLLRSLVRNRNGLFWAGDTAQTIAAGSAFRFTELKAFQYRIEEKLESENPHITPMTKPKDFQLTVNYRSHAGIVDCAHSVIDLLKTFWRNQIDILAAEKGLVDGQKPIFFVNLSNESDSATRYANIFTSNSESAFELGAQQCVIVRNEAAKERFEQEVNNSGFVFTVYESKGLEFDDVFLWKFFEDSTADATQWRVILGGIDQRHRPVHCPNFDETKHAGICIELKSLYVSVTRCRKRLWIFDNSEKAEPMKTYWGSKQSVDFADVFLIDDKFSVQSSPKEWVERGKELFDSKRFSAAALAFKRAGRTDDAAIADAYVLKQNAQLSPSYDTSKLFIRAAQAFGDCSKNQRTTEHKNERLFMRIAAECWESAGQYNIAAERFLEAGKYASSARNYFQAKMLTDMVKVLKVHRHEIQDNEREMLMDKAKKYYFEYDQLDKGLALFEPKSNVAAVEFMKRYPELDRVRARFLESLGDFIQAAEVHLKLRHIEEAVRLFKAILAQLWACPPFGTSMNDDDKAVAKWLEKSSSLTTTKLLSDNERQEILMFRCIAAADTEELFKLSQNFQKRNNITVALLCLDDAYGKSLTLYVLPYRDVTTFLRRFSEYLQLIDNLKSLRDPHDSELCKKLFGIRGTNENSVILPLNSVLSRYRTELRKHDSLTLSVFDFQPLLDRFLSSRTQTRIETIVDAIMGESFIPCIDQLSGRFCPRNQYRCRCLHINQPVATVKWYNERVGLFIQIIHTVDLLTTEKMLQNEWNLFGKLYDIVYPPIHSLGCWANLNSSYIPDATEGFKAIRSLVRCVSKKFSEQLQFEDKDSETDGIISLTSIMKWVFTSYVLYGDESLFFPELQTTHQLATCSMKDEVNPTCILQKFVSSLSTESRDSIPDGLEFLEFVFDEMIPVNVGVICDLMDWLSGLIVVASYLSRYNSLHHVLLPRTWLLRLSRVFGSLIKKGGILEAPHFFVQLAETLLDRLDPQAPEEISEHLIVGEKDCIPADLRGIYISRVCRSLCLFGGNILDEDLRSRILSVINSLSEKTHPLYSMYVSAQEWADLRNALFDSSFWNSPLDELVRLRNTVEGEEQPLSPIVTDLVYEKIEHIASSLSYEPRPDLPRGQLSTQIFTKLYMACDEVDDYIHWMMEEERWENNRNLRDAYEETRRLRDVLQSRQGLVPPRNTTELELKKYIAEVKELLSKTSIRQSYIIECDRLLLGIEPHMVNENWH